MWQRLSRALLLLLLAAPAAGQELQELIATARVSVAHLRILDASGREIGTGSGFFLRGRPGLLLTNWHVVERASAIEAVVPPGESFPVRLIAARDEVNDLALLEVDRQDIAGLPLAPLAAAVAVGDEVVVIGSPLGLADTVSTGIISGKRTAVDLDGTLHEDALPRLQISAAISPGSSGSPVMNRSGEVVGVAVSQYLVGQSLNFAVPHAAVHELLAGGSRVERIEQRLGEVGPVSRLGYLRNVGISLVFFLLIALALRKLR